MADKYTYADVIIDPDDPRVEIGAEYYASKNIPEALFKANDGDEMFCYKLLSIHDGAYGPFWMDKEEPSAFDFIIRKKESEKKYVPFDLSDPEVRKSLRGKWIKNKENHFEICITAFTHQGHVGNTISADIYRANDIEADELLNYWVFDDGTPCGKIVEADE